MKFLDFFSGIGGFRLGFEMAGHECVGHVEWDKYAQQSYTAMHDVKEDEYVGWDIRAVRASELPHADCWNFGAPCQDFSIAGQRAGMEGDRSSLVREVFRLVRETEEENRPEWLLYENVKGMLSSNGGRDFLGIILEMDELGYDVEWQTLNSKNFGVPQNRERVFTLGHSRRYGGRKVFPIEGTDSEIDVYQVAQVYGTDAEPNPSGGRVYDSEHLMRTLGAGHGMSQPMVLVREAAILKPERTEYGREIRKAYESGEIEESRHNMTKLVPREDDITNTITTVQKDNYLLVREATSTGYAIAEPGDSINLEQPNSQTRRGRVGKGVANTLTTSCNQAMILDDMYANREPRVYEDYAPTLRSDRTGLKVVEPEIFALRGRPGKDGDYIQKIEVNENGISNTITTVQKDNLLYEHSRIRKLTPKECWRLQGFPDEYFERAKASGVSDSQLYKQAGNSVTVNVIYEIARRLEVTK